MTVDGGVDYAALIRAATGFPYFLLGLFLVLRRPRTRVMVLWGVLHLARGFTIVYFNAELLAQNALLRPLHTSLVVSVAFDALAVGILAALFLPAYRSLSGPKRRIIALLTGGLVLLSIAGALLLLPNLYGPHHDVILDTYFLASTFADPIAGAAFAGAWIIGLETLRSGTSSARWGLLALFPFIGEFVQNPASHLVQALGAPLVQPPFLLSDIPAILAALLSLAPLLWCFRLMKGPDARWTRNVQAGLYVWTAVLCLYTQVSIVGVLGTLPGIMRILSLGTIGYAIIAGDFLPMPLKRPTARRGALAGLALAALLISTQVLQNLLSAGGNLVVGGVITGVVVFASLPLQRAAERAVEKRKHHAGQDSPASKYRRHAEIAWIDGNLSANERLMLAETRRQLGLDAETAASIDEQVAAWHARRRKRPA